MASNTLARRAATLLPVIYNSPAPSTCGFGAKIILCAFGCWTAFPGKSSGPYRQIAPNFGRFPCDTLNRRFAWWLFLVGMIRM